MEDSMEVLKGLRITSLDEEESEQNDVDVYDINDDDDDDDEVCIPTTLGFVEKPEKPWALLRQLFPSKAGGTPAWLDPINLPSRKSFFCDFCEEPLQFLLQVYAPISEKESSFHRVLYVFTCMSMTCMLRDQHEQWRREPQKQSRSVKVWRCQLPRTNQFYSSNPPKYDGSDRPLGSGAPLCTWCGTWKGDKVCSSCRQARYCSEKHQAMNWCLGHKLKCRQITAASSPCSMPSQEIQQVASTSLWPDFEIKIEDECESDVEIPQEQVVETGKLDLDESEGGDEDKVSWATFQERIGRAPEQVIRYCRDPGARPLWPMSSGRPSKSDIPKCSYCGGDRNFEFQILPQLLYYFGVQNEPNSIDWASISTAEKPQDNLAAMYRPPFALMYQGSFEKAKVAAASEDKWLLVNLQSNKEFSSHMLNRDTWGNEAVAQTIKSNFIFWQVYDETTDGKKVCTYYKVDSVPVVLIIDPITGQKMRLWSGMIHPDRLLEDLFSYMDKGPQNFVPLTKKRPIEAAPFHAQKIQEAPAVSNDEDEELQQALAFSMEGLVEAEKSASEDDKPADNEVDASLSKRRSYPPLPDEPKADKSLLCRIGFRLPDGRRVQRNFLRIDPVQMLWSFCYSQLGEDKERAFRLAQAIPGCSKTVDYDSKHTVGESGLANSMILVTWE